MKSLAVILATVAIALGAALFFTVERGIDDLNDANVKLSGLASLSNSLQEENRWLLSEARRLDSVRRADSAAAADAYRAVSGKLSALIADAQARGVDTVWVPVATIIESETALKTCTDATRSCEASLSAERSLRVNAEQQRDAAVAEATLARKLVPTAGQKLRHDAKVVGLTAAVVVTLLTFLEAVTP